MKMLRVLKVGGLCAFALLPACKAQQSPTQSSIRLDNSMHVAGAPQGVMQESAQELPLQSATLAPVSSAAEKQADSPQNNMRLEGDSCTPEVKPSQTGRFGQAECANAMICVPNIIEMDVGTCRLPCGRQEGNEIVKSPDSCPAGRSCQLINVGADEPLGAYCLPQQEERDGMCFALDDADACTQGRQCSISAMQNTQEGSWFGAMVCRERCPFGDKNASDSCTTPGEVCRADKFTQEFQNTGDQIASCSVKECKKSGNPLCACDTKRAFACRAPIEGDDHGVCIRPAGVCVHEVAGLTAAALAKKTIDTCNEVTDHRFCSGEAYQLPNSHASYNRGRCGQIFGGDQGICLNICTSPLEVTAQMHPLARLKGTCGEGFVCNDNLAKALHQRVNLALKVPMHDPENPQMEKKCDLTRCPEDAFCPEECGHAESICADLDDVDENGEKIGTCTVYLNTCEPVADSQGTDDKNAMTPVSP